MKILAFFTSLSRSLLGLAVVFGLSACATQPVPTENEQPLPTTEAATLGIIPAPTSGDLVLCAVGDIMLDGTARPILRESGYDYPFLNMRQFFKDAQIIFGNLEGPLTDKGTAEDDKKYTFRSPPDLVAPALQRAGFNVVSLANNHTLDYGVIGLQQTMQALDKVGIQYVGAGMDLQAARRPAILTVGETRIAVLGYSMTLPENFYAAPGKPGTAFGHDSHVHADIAKARSQADIVVVSFHWGQESKTSLREYQTRLGRAAIDAGASVVIGHHPHILQGVEQYQGGVILYSLGNFTFGSYSNRSTRSVVAQLVFRERQLVSLRMIPINVNNFEVQFQPRPLYGQSAHSVVRELQELSMPLNTKLQNEGGTAFLSLSPASAAR